MKTPKRPHVVPSKLDRVPDEVGTPLEGRYRLQSKSIACYATLDHHVNIGCLQAVYGVFTQPGPIAAVGVHEQCISL